MTTSRAAFILLHFAQLFAGVYASETSDENVFIQTLGAVQRRKVDVRANASKSNVTRAKVYAKTKAGNNSFMAQDIMHLVDEARVLEHTLHHSVNTDFESPMDLSEKIFLDPELSSDFTRQDKAEITHIINEVSETFTPEEAATNAGNAEHGFLVTGDLLRTVFANGTTVEDTTDSMHFQAEHRNETRGAGLAQIKQRKTKVGLIQGDMMTGSAAHKDRIQKDLAAGKKWAGVLWLDGYVPFCFASDIAPDSREAFGEAANKINSIVPCLHFEEVDLVQGSSTDPADYKKCAADHGLFVQSEPDGGCYAQVGVETGISSTLLSLETSKCTTIGTALHELGHALGMVHEHQRADRDAHVIIHWDNIIPGKENNFAVDPDADTVQPYDSLSIMHYGTHYFGITNPVYYEGGPETKKATMEMQPDAEFVGMEDMEEGWRGSYLGQRMGLSEADAAQLGTMYGCSYDSSNLICNLDANAACNTADCICPQGDFVMVQETTSTGEACHKCYQQCPRFTLCTTSANPSCACPAGLIKFAGLSTDLEDCYSCRTPEEMYCPDAPSGSKEAGCTCPSDKLKGSGVTSDGATIYMCHSQCPDIPQQSSDSGCFCPSNQNKVTVFDKPSSEGGVSGRACETGARVTQYGCACQQTWEAYGFTQTDYCQQYAATGQFCILEDPACEPSGLSYGWCANIN